jgi:hypothetical protein
MPRLKSLTQHPPHGFLYIEPAAGMKKPFTGSFKSVVDQVSSLRRANKYLAEKHGWSLDRAGIEYDVEQQNVARCIAHGWTEFLQSEAVAYPPPQGELKKNLFGNAVGTVKRVAAGVGVLIDWLGQGGKPVEQALAEHRANVCATCPKNDGGDWKSYFTGKVADKIRTQLEIKNDLSLRTSQDDKLTVCSACDCPLQLKVHTPLTHILAHTTEDVKKKLDPRCWILHEKA